LELLRSGRLEVGEGVVFEPLVWLTAGDSGRIRLGDGVLINVNVLIAASDLVEIGDHTMIANGCVVTDSNHRFGDHDLPITWQGFSSKGPTRIGSNCWLGAGTVVTSGVTIGERCVIGAGSVVTSDIPAFSVAAGSPAKVISRNLPST
jgi:acetyltransferase-like isoleucine patch superfamily enzyme